MYSEASTELWNNELLEALLAEPGISAKTKEVCNKLKHKHNPWQKELRDMWKALPYPEYTQSDVVRLNSSWKKHIESVNQQRNNQRNYYMQQGNYAAAALIGLEEDKSLNEKACIVKEEKRILGWIPAKNDFILLCNPGKPDLDSLTELVDQCVHSGATNIPKSIKNLMEEGIQRGFTEQAYTSLWLQFIKRYIENSYQAALTYSRNLNELFEFLLSLVDTETEITKLRNAISKIQRKQEDPVSFAVLKMKSLTTSLLFMIDPSASLAEVTKRASRASIDALYTIISEEAKTHLTAWKRKCNEMGRTTTLQDYLDAVSKIEQSKSCKPARDYIVPSRLADSDVTANSFYAKFGLEKPRSRSIESSKIQKSSSNTPQSSRTSSRASSNGSRGTPRRAGTSSSRATSVPSRTKDDRNRGYSYEVKNQRAREEGRYKKGEDRREKERRPRRESGGSQNRGNGKKTGRGHSSKGMRKSEYPDNSTGIQSKDCKKCGSLSHFSKECERYPFYYEEACKHCNKQGRTLYHPPELCRFQKSRYRTPPPRSSPVSYKSNENLSSIFQGN